MNNQTCTLRANLSGFRLLYSCSLILVVIFATIHTPLYGQLDPANLKTLKAATVYITTPTSTGSGFLVFKQGKLGLVATNAHVVGREPVVQLSFNSGSNLQFDLSGTVAGIDLVNDLALIRVESNTLPEPLKIQKITPGLLVETQQVYCCGFPLGEKLTIKGKTPEPTISKGNISSLRTSKLAIPALIQADIAVNPGNSGGPLIDTEGNVIGMVTLKVNGTDVCIAVPSNFIDDSIDGAATWVVGRLTDADQEKSKVEMNGLLIDPFDRIDRVNILVFDGKVKYAADQDKHNSWRPMESAKRVQCKKKGLQFFCSESFDTIQLTRRNIWYQVESVRKNGTKHYTEPLRLEPPNYEDVSIDPTESRNESKILVVPMTPQDIMAINKKLGPRPISPSVFGKKKTQEPDRNANAKPAPDADLNTLPAMDQVTKKNQNPGQSESKPRSETASGGTSTETKNPFREVQRKPNASSKPQLNVTSSLANKTLETQSARWSDYTPKQVRKVNKPLLLPPSATKEGFNSARILVEAKTLLPRLQWSQDGKTLFALSSTGRLHAINLQQSQESLEIDLGFEVVDFGLNQEGIVILTKEQQLILLDESTWKVKLSIESFSNGTLYTSAASARCFLSTLEGKTLYVSAFDFKKKIHVLNSIELEDRDIFSHYIDVGRNRILTLNAKQISAFSIAKSKITKIESHELPTTNQRRKAGILAPLGGHHFAVLTQLEPVEGTATKRAGEFLYCEVENPDSPILVVSVSDIPKAVIAGPAQSFFLGGTHQQLSRIDASEPDLLKPMRFPGRPGNAVALAINPSEEQVAVLSTETLTLLDLVSLSDQ